MLFNTTQFFLFLAVTLAAFYASPRGARKYILLGASYFFYASWNPKFIALLLTLTAIDYSAGLALESVRPARDDGRPLRAGFVLEGFRTHGITYAPSVQDRSALYLELLPLLNAGRVRLLVPRLAAASVLGPKLSQFARDYPDVVLDVSRGLGEPMRGIELSTLRPEEMLSPRGW